MYHEAIEQLTLQLQTQNIVLTQRHIGRYLAQPAILRDPDVRKILREVRCEVEHIISGSKGMVSR